MINTSNQYDKRKVEDNSTHLSEENDFQTSLANINVEEFAQNSKIETYDETAFMLKCYNNK